MMEKLAELLAESAVELAPHAVTYTFWDAVCGLCWCSVLFVAVAVGWRHVCRKCVSDDDAFDMDEDVRSALWLGTTMLAVVVLIALSALIVINIHNVADPLGATLHGALRAIGK